MTQFARTGAPARSPLRRGLMFVLSSPSGAGKTTMSRALMAEADLLFASHRDLQVVLGLEFPQATPQERFAAGAAEAFRAFPHLRQMAATVRVEQNTS